MNRFAKYSWRVLGWNMLVSLWDVEIIGPAIVGSLLTGDTFSHPELEDL